QPPIGAAIGVHHQDRPPGAVQAHGLANLVEDEFTVALVLRRRQTLRSASNFDRVGIHHADALQELAKAQVKPVIETPEDGGVAMILLARSIEMKNLFPEDSFGFTPIRFSHASCSDFPQCPISIL